MDITVIIEKMIMLFLVMMIGYGARKIRVFDDRAVGNFSSLVVNISMPCLMLSSAAMETTLGKSDVFLFLGVAVAMYIALAVFAWIIPLVLRIKREENGMFQFMAMFSNNGFMGFPVIQAILGKEALLLASILNLPINIMMYTYGVFLIIKDDKRSSRFQWKRFLNPGVIAGLAALVFYLMEFRWPSAIGDVLVTVGDMTTPLAMLVLGASLADVPVGDVFKDWRIYAFSFIRLIVLPFLVWIPLAGLFDNRLIWGVLVITTGMPCATATVMMCTEYGKPGTTASKHVFMSTVFSVITIPALAFILFR